MPTRRTMKTHVLRIMNPKSPAAIFREGTIPVVRLSLCTMMQKIVPIKAPDAKERNCTGKPNLSACVALQADLNIENSGL